MKQLATVNFKSRIVREFSSSPRPVGLGEHDTTMTLYGPTLLSPARNNKYYAIEWDIPGAEETVEYGIWVQDGILVDYDGAFSLPSQAIKLLRDNGITVPVEFE